MSQALRRLAGAVLLLALTALGWASVVAVSPPAPLGADAPPDQFSAARAFTHVEQVGSQVHVAGSAAAREVRRHIQSTLAGLGVESELQEAVGATDSFGGFAMAHVTNVVAVLRGTASTGRVFLTAHYDSVQVSYGANDDGAGVATILETVRALRAGPPLRNDLVLVFTDAEEACLCGAEAFESRHPLAADGGVVLNFESRGTSGPAIAFETTRGNAGLVSEYARSVPYPVATSFAVEVYRILPNDTDFTPFRESGRFAGLNTAYIDGSAAYHTPQDRPEYLDPASLQHHGANALALARGFGSADIPTLSRTDGGDATYFPVLGALIRYPGWWVWPLAGLALVCVGLLGWLAVRRGVARWSRLGAAFGLGLIPLLLAPLSAQLTWSALKWARPGYANLSDPWQPGWYRLAVVALVGAVLLTWYVLLRRRIGAWPMAIGALSWCAVLGVVSTAVVPGGAYLTVLPALAGAGAAAVALRWPDGWPAAVAVLAAGAVGVVVLVPTVALFFPALGLALGAAPAFFAVLLGLLLLPAFELTFPAPIGQRQAFAAAAAPVVAAMVTVVALAVGFVVDRFDSVHPAPVQLMYALDKDSRTASWIAPTKGGLPWSEQFFTGTSSDIEGRFPLAGTGWASGPAEVADLPGSTIDIIDDSTIDGHRTISLLITPQRPVRLVYLDVPGSTVIAMTADGRAVPDEVLEPDFDLVFHAPPPEGLRVTVTLDGTGPVQLRVMDCSDGLDALPGFRPRPPGVGVLGSHTSEMVAVVRSQRV